LATAPAAPVFGFVSSFDFFERFFLPEYFDWLLEEFLSSEELPFCSG
jgi:hypothetical protein